MHCSSFCVTLGIWLVYSSGSIVGRNVRKSERIGKYIITLLYLLGLQVRHVSPTN